MIYDVPIWWRKSVLHLFDLHRKIVEAEDEVSKARDKWSQTKIQHEICYALWKERRKRKGKAK